MIADDRLLLYQTELPRLAAPAGFEPATHRL